MNVRTKKRRSQHKQDNMLGDAVTMANNSFFSDNFRNVYNNVDKSFSSLHFDDIMAPQTNANSSFSSSLFDDIMMPQTHAFPSLISPLPGMTDYSQNGMPRSGKSASRNNAANAANSKKMVQSSVSNSMHEQKKDKKISASINKPNILNFDLKNNKSKQTTNNAPKTDNTNVGSKYLNTNHSSDNNNESTNKESNQIDMNQNKNSEKKYGIKKLLSTQSKIIYPFNKMDQIVDKTSSSCSKHLSENTTNPLVMLRNEVSSIALSPREQPSLLSKDKVFPLAKPMEIALPPREQPSLLSKDKVVVVSDQMNIDYQHSQSLNSVKKSDTSSVNDKLENNMVITENKSIQEQLPKDEPNKNTSNCSNCSNIEKKMDQFIEQEGLTVKESFIETEKIEKTETQNTSRSEPNYLQFKPFEQNNRGTALEILSDIESSMASGKNIKKIDIKNDDNTIVNMNSKKESETNMNDNKPVTEEEPKNSPVISKDLDTAETIHLEEKLNESKEKDEWPELSIEDINTTFKVIGDLRDGAKLKIVENRYLAEDTAYFTSVTRYSSGQSREKTMSFLSHLFNETKRNTEQLLVDIRNNIDVDTRVSELENVISNMMVFMHKYDVMRNVYKSDTGAHAKLGVIRNKFYTFRGSLFRDLAIPKN